MLGKQFINLYASWTKTCMQKILCVDVIKLMTSSMDWDGLELSFQSMDWIGLRGRWIGLDWIGKNQSISISAAIVCLNEILDAPLKLYVHNFRKIHGCLLIWLTLEKIYELLDFHINNLTWWTCPRFCLISDLKYFHSIHLYFSFISILYFPCESINRP